MPPNLATLPAHPALPSGPWVPQRTEGRKTPVMTEPKFSFEFQGRVELRTRPELAPEQPAP